MNEILQIINYLKNEIKNYETNTTDLENYFDSLISNMTPDGTYKINEEEMKKAIIEAFQSLNLEGKTEKQKIIEIKDLFYYEDSKVGEYNKINSLKLNLNFGTQMEKLYFNEDIIVGLHSTALDEDSIKTKIFEEGLLSTRGPMLNQTVALKETTLTLLNFLNRWYKANAIEKNIIIVIPKDDINAPMWKEGEDGCLLTPEYIYGYYISHFMAENNPNPTIITNQNYGSPKEDYQINDEYLETKQKPKIY